MWRRGADGGRIACRHWECRTQRAWLTVPSTLPNVAALVAGRQYGVLVWRQPATTPATPTELHLPASFNPATTVVVGDLATRLGVPASGGAVTAVPEVGSASSRRLLLDATGTAAGAVHVLLVANAATGTVPAATLTAAKAELTAWAVAL